MGILVVASLVATRNIQRVPSGIQNLMEYALEFIRDLTKNQIGEKEYRPWVPFIGTLFLFIFVSNWSGALVPWRLIKLPAGELAMLTSLAYFYAGFSKRGWGYFKKYIEPT